MISKARLLYQQLLNGLQQRLWFEKQPPSQISPDFPETSAAPAAEVASILDNRTFMKLAERCADLLDELDVASEHFDNAQREVAAHVQERLQDALAACGAELINQDGPFDRALHQPIRKTSGIAPGDPSWTARIISPGLKLERRVLRRARVQVEHFSSSPVLATPTREENYD